LGAILGLLKLLYEHKEKILLGALIIAFAGVGYMHREKIMGGDPSADNAKGPPKKPKKPPRADDKGKGDTKKTKKYPIPNLGNRLSVEQMWALTDEEIFVIPEAGQDATEETAEVRWPTIEIKSIFDPTKSGNFFAIIEVNGRREIKKEGETIEQHYLLRNIDGIRNCLTIINRKSPGGNDEREFCK
jgi:hypothetical protein